MLEIRFKNIHDSIICLISMYIYIYIWFVCQVISRTVSQVLPQRIHSAEPQRFSSKELPGKKKYIPWKIPSNHSSRWCSYPVGSMYGIYANIGDILMVNVTIYIDMDPMGMKFWGLLDVFVPGVRQGFEGPPADPPMSRGRESRNHGFQFYYGISIESPIIIITFSGI